MMYLTLGGEWRKGVSIALDEAWSSPNKEGVKGFLQSVQYMVLGTERVRSGHGLSVNGTNCLRGETVALGEKAFGFWFE